MTTDPTMTRIAEAVDLHHRQGRPEAARDHLQHARTNIDELADDDYGRLIRDGLNRLSEQLNATT